MQVRYFVVLLAGLSLSGCSLFKAGRVDAEGRNELERKIIAAIRLGEPEEDKDHLLPPPPELLDEGFASSSHLPSSQPQNASTLPPSVSSTTTSSQNPIVGMRAPVTQVADASPYDDLIAIPDVHVQDVKSMPAREDYQGQQFPEPQAPGDALKKYMDAKNNEGDDEILVPMTASHVNQIKPIDASSALKEKYPGVIAYSAFEKVFQSVSEKKIQEIADRLIKNPNESVMFQGQLGEGEQFELVQKRFDLILSKLAMLKVPKNQILLDEKRVVGEWPEFKIYILHL
jgi:hypothetical protein